METSNATIADFLRRYAAVLSVGGADRFKLKAYKRAAETIESLDEAVADLTAKGRDLTDLPGIGKAINEVILEIVHTGKLARLEQSVAQLPSERAELASRPALDPKKIERVYKKLHINTLAALRTKLDDGTIREQFGARMDFHIRQGLNDRPRHLLWSVRDIAKSVEAFLKKLPEVERVSQTGSLRRKQETVGDLNFLVCGKSAAVIFKAFSKYGSVASSEAASRIRKVFHLSSGMSVALQWTPADQWGLSLLLTTGSQAHLSELATYSESNALTMTVSSLLDHAENLTEEKNVYSAVRLKYIQPELREGRGEVAAAAKRQLPSLITQKHLLGDLHMHTTASDGANTIEEMATAAQARGYQYIAITDHSQSLKITNGLTENRLLEHIAAIDKLNENVDGLRILKSAEVDILEDGKLDYSAAVLRKLDFTICSIHSRFALNKERQTERIMRAMDNRYFNILGHATGRLLLSREGYQFDMDRIIDHAKANGCLFEINSSPNRLDLSDEHAKQAKEAGIKIAINTDAHSIKELDFISAGVLQARRAWLEADDVLNTYPVAKMLQLLKR